jgi:uncharacterized membrane protein YkvA (DUF1232 family)
MPLRVTFELQDEDLRYLRERMEEIRGAMAEQEEPAIIGGAREMLAKLEGASVPDFVRQRTGALGEMIAMLEDAEWALDEADRQRVLQALAYFSAPDDLIPDHIPGFGFLDDAIMIELVARELRPEIEAYADFRAFRQSEAARLGNADHATLQHWLERRRRDLHARMRRRRSSGTRRGRRSPFSLLP